MYYKIYIRESCVFLTDTTDGLEAVVASPGLVAPFPQKKKFILNYVDALEKATAPQNFVFVQQDIQAAWEAFLDCFDYMEAAGGLVFNEKHEILAIFRRGYWDLPKGKIDPGEDAATAATREVIEETGVEGLTIGKKIGDTWHVYRTGKAIRVLKQTHWFAFQTHNQALTPQVEEDIEEACWMDFSAFQQAEPAYGSIREICKTYGSL